jgi:predicted SnoaL-like aldol condensation-catalyzing enzyme
MKTFLFLLPLVLFLSGCMRHNPQLLKESDLNKKVVMSFYNTALNERNPAKSVGLLTNNVESRSVKGDTLLSGRTEIANSISNFLNNFRDVKFIPEWTYSEGELVIVRWVIKCTPKENYLTFSAGSPLEKIGRAHV